MVRGRIAQRVEMWTFLLVGVIGLLLFFSGAARADFYPGIDTTDSDISDWNEVFANGEFWTDDPGDVTNPDEDWITAWVSQTGTSDTDRVHFLMEILGPGVLDDPNRAAGVDLDCNRDGVMTDNDDAKIGYDPLNPGNWDDMVVVCSGLGTNCVATGNRDLGQKFSVTDGEATRYFVEWGIPIEYVPPWSGQEGLETQNCKDLIPTDENDKLIDIRFGTADSTVGSGLPPIDGSDFFGSYNITTVIDLNSFNAQNNSSSSSLPLLLAGGAMIVVGFGGFILARRKKS